MSRDVEIRGQPVFPSTCWTQLHVDPAQDPQATAAALDVLAQRYWRPIAAYVRSRFARSDDDARDATQEFFLWILESGFLQRADRDRGSFRGFVKRSLANFLNDRERKRRTIKRGGARAVLSLSGDEPIDVPDTAAADPEALLDDLWRRSLLSQAAEALETELDGKGKRKVFEVFRDYFLGDEELEYTDVAERYSISKVDVSNYLADAKRRYRAHLRTAVIDTVHNDEELRLELEWLFGEES